MLEMSTRASSRSRLDDIAESNSTRTTITASLAFLGACYFGLHCLLKQRTRVHAFGDLMRGHCGKNKGGSDHRADRDPRLIPLRRRCLAGLARTSCSFSSVSDPGLSFSNRFS